MLNEAIVLQQIEPYLNAKRELSAVEFVELFIAGELPLTLHEQYEVIRIMIAHDIEYGDEKEEETAALEQTKIWLQQVTEQDITQLKCMKNEQLCLLAQKGDQRALATLVEKNHLYVYKEAVRVFQQFRQASLTVDDLVSCGNIGLLRAAKDYDTSKDTRFITYAAVWIWQKMTRAIKNEGYPIRLPEYRFEEVIKVQNYGRKNPEASRDELVAIIQADAPAMSREKIMYLFRLGKLCLNTTSLNAPIGDGDTELGELKENMEEFSMEALAENKALRESLEQVLATLTEREEMVLRLRFGIEDGKVHTLDDVGKRFDLTRERIRQIEAKALRKIRHPSRSKKLKGYLEWS